eukprot:COSAG02_NODE_15683_length_1149_cov_0.568571_1_plen_257_part_00
MYAANNTTQVAGIVKEMLCQQCFYILLSSRVIAATKLSQNGLESTSLWPACSRTIISASSAAASCSPIATNVIFSILHLCSDRRKPHKRGKRAERTLFEWNNLVLSSVREQDRNSSRYRRHFCSATIMVTLGCLDHTCLCFRKVVELVKEQGGEQTQCLQRPPRVRAHTHTRTNICVVSKIISATRTGFGSPQLELTGVTIGNATSTMAESDKKGHSRIKATPWPRAASSSATEPPMLCPSKTTLSADTPKPVGDP